jgi:membrane-associated phospholipid phosphatase
MRRVLFAALMLGITSPAFAGGSESVGTGVAIALPAIAGGITLYKDDWMGAAQLTVDTVATVGLAYGLKHVIREQRPDKSDFQSMPSDTSALAFAPAQFLWDRYGWEYGLPAYAAATFVGWSRVDANKHHWYDVAASAGIAFGMSQIFTTHYRPKGLTYGVAPTKDGLYASLDYRF